MIAEKHADVKIIHLELWFYGDRKILHGPFHYWWARIFSPPLLHLHNELSDRQHNSVYIVHLWWWMIVPRIVKKKKKKKIVPHIYIYIYIPIYLVQRDGWFFCNVIFNLMLMSLSLLECTTLKVKKKKRQKETENGEYITDFENKKNIVHAIYLCWWNKVIAFASENHF